jgi:hypothetical protein
MQVISSKLGFVSGRFGSPFRRRRERPLGRDRRGRRALETAEDSWRELMRNVTIWLDRAERGMFPLLLAEAACDWVSTFVPGCPSGSAAELGPAGHVLVSVRSQRGGHYVA